MTPRAQDIHQRMLSNASETSSHASNEKPTPTTKEPPSYLQHIQTHSRNQYQVQSPLSVSFIHIYREYALHPNFKIFVGELFY